MQILGIETSCDETAVAIVRGDKTILSNLVWSQTEAHRPYGGVVPEIASRAHLEKLAPLISQSLEESGLGWDDIDAVAVTAGPGLIGGVLVGAMMAKAIASVQQKPILAVNHLEGHALSPRLVADVQFPYLLLLVSGGHCQLLVAEGVGRYHLLGKTLDDAAGEAFDKVAKLLGLPYPGGPALEQRAKLGDPSRYTLTQPLQGRPGCDFSFSGLKTAVSLLVKAERERGPLPESTVNDIAATFQSTVVQFISSRTQAAIMQLRAQFPAALHLVVAGGVAANASLRAELERLAAQAGLVFVAPPHALCTDNAAMIAWAGIERLSAGLQDDIRFEPRARWPLSELRSA